MATEIYESIRIGSLATNHVYESMGTKTDRHADPVPKQNNKRVYYVLIAELVVTLCVLVVCVYIALAGTTGQQTCVCTTADKEYTTQKYSTASSPVVTSVLSTSQSTPPAVAQGWSPRVPTTTPTAPMAELSVCSIHDCLTASGCLSGPDRYPWRCQSIQYMQGRCLVYAESLTLEPIAPSGDSNFWTRDLMTQNWIPVFQVQSGSLVDSYSAWMSNGTNPNDTNTINPLVIRDEYWNRIKEIKVAMLVDDKEVMTTIFNAVDSNRVDWFTQERIITSPFNDIKTKSVNCLREPINCFGVEGYRYYRSTRRRFYAVNSHAGCSRDYVWFVVRQGNAECSWENGNAPVILYCNKSTVCNAYDLSRADTFAVSVKMM